MTRAETLEAADTGELSPVLDQPPPTPNDKPAVWGLVIADMHERDKVGRQRYGTPLQPHNGRDALVDAYQEGLDLVVYLRQRIEEHRSFERQDRVEDFRRACGLAMGDFSNPKIGEDGQAELAAALVQEELDELREAIADRDIVQAGDAIADLLVTVYGVACVLGLDAGPLFDEVHRTNMAKVGGPRREDGKLLKPPGWKPPDIAAVVERQRRPRR